MMEILLDTHTFLWWSLQPEKLPPVVLKALQDPDNRVFFSTVSSWEAQIKIGLGKLILEESLRKIVERELVQNNWEVLPVTLHHTWKLEQLPPLHKDPFDRLLVAQALAENLVIATRDPLIRAYPDITILWDQG
jgi:PIN domain nuclease of toxin-antitoxin system